MIATRRVEVGEGLAAMVVGLGETAGALEEMAVVLEVTEEGLVEMAEATEEVQVATVFPLEDGTIHPIVPIATALSLPLGREILAVVTTHLILLTMEVSFLCQRRELRSIFAGNSARKFRSLLSQSGMANPPPLSNTSASFPITNN
ncbi:hypothetical protein PLEOSDRAFT_1082708 [Pleurotus ostreatus PC15]|uniref:Uncharacterized protein n=1 Tax=Pleurotus ostreatus (strain PC15) TaxID=1137138 RepID=A0A067NX45_PLEO1|nr:hypothetical protein PLEOSDRAFT_1082708 [Pleurotus ostreatus PC15]